ncbi:MAG: hypothetical protein V7K67_26780 [Nostoc sp.]|uniref:hypothetical protein n=1 Tax=Nostoc sp. TaxID=1180 RepID=UPI002FF431DC
MYDALSAGFPIAWMPYCIRHKSRNALKLLVESMVGIIPRTSLLIRVDAPVRVTKEMKEEVKAKEDPPEFCRQAIQEKLDREK